MRLTAFFISCLLAAFVPFIGKEKPGLKRSTTKISWPGNFEGRKLIRLGLSSREAGFIKDFPGEIARFTDGRRSFIFRAVSRPTRRLHPARDCLRASGYTVLPHPLRRDQKGQLWGCLKAFRGKDKMKVCEIIKDLQGRSWQDVSSWYWSSVLGKTKGPWLAVTVSGPEL